MHCEYAWLWQKVHNYANTHVDKNNMQTCANIINELNLYLRTSTQPLHPLFIEVPTSSKESERSCMCALGV
jgi:uncharacterized protein (UPF0305 family)